MLNIRDALKQLTFEQREYFLWKFPDLARNAKQRTEEEFLKHVRRKNIETLQAFEMTPTYKQLVSLYLDSKSASDLLEIYNSIAEKARDGNETAVRVFLALRKQITEEAKAASDAFRELQVESEEEECDLII